jgi:CubicO group peptidase (beta-lactamase class C family)
MTVDLQIAHAAHHALRQKTFPGCVVGYVTKDGERNVLPFGTFTYEKNSPAVTRDSVYDVASITKSIPTAALALRLIDLGELRPTDKLIDTVPEFRTSDRENVLIQHLLTYGLDGYGLARSLDTGNRLAHLFNGGGAQELRNLLFTREFIERPGTIFTYSNVPSALLGIVLERSYGEPLDVAADKYFFDPLGMKNTTFHPEHMSQENIVPTEINEWRGEVRGVVHDEGAWLASRDHVVMGHAGLFSTAGDILTFMEMLLQGGVYEGKRYFSEAIVREMETNQIPHLGESTGLGWELDQPRYMGEHCTPHTFGKTGFTGTLCVADRSKGVAYTILSNRIYPQRATDSVAINTFRAAVGNILLADSH